MTGSERGFDPRAILASFERNYVGYVLIGGLAQVLRGADQVTTGVDICPSFAKDNIDRLAQAIGELDARAPDEQPLMTISEQTLTTSPVIELLTNVGELKIVASPAGVPNGYVDLRRAATKAHLGHGVQALIASPGDLAAMAAALHREKDLDRLPTMRRIVELEVDRQHTLPRPAEPSPQLRRGGSRRGQRLIP